MNKDHFIARDAARHLSHLERLHGLLLVDGPDVLIIQDHPDEFRDIFRVFDVLGAERFTPDELFDVIGGRALFRVTSGFLARCSYATSKLAAIAAVERLCAEGHKPLRRWRGRDLHDFLARSRARIDALGALLRGDARAPLVQLVDCRGGASHAHMAELDAVLVHWEEGSRRKIARVVGRANALFGLSFSACVIDHLRGVVRSVQELSLRVDEIFAHVEELATRLALAGGRSVEELSLPEELSRLVPRGKLPQVAQLLGYAVARLQRQASSLTPRGINLERFASLDPHDAVSRLRAEINVRLAKASELEFPRYMFACVWRSAASSLPDGAWLDESRYRIIWYAFCDAPRAVASRHWALFARTACLDVTPSRKCAALFALEKIATMRPPDALIERVFAARRWRSWSLAPDWRAMRAYLDVAARLSQTSVIDVQVDDASFVALFERSPARAERIVLAVCNESEVDDPASLAAVYLDLIDHVPAVQPLLGPFLRQWEHVPDLHASARPPGYDELLALGNTAESLDAYLHYRALAGEPSEFSRALLDLCDEGEGEVAQRAWLREQLELGLADESRLELFQEKLAALEDPERARGREAARARRAVNLTERALGQYRARSLALGFESVSRRMLERLLGEAPPRELPDGVFASFSLLASSDTDHALFERFLRDALAGRSFVEWPANATWIDESKARFDVDVWLRGFAEVIDVAEIGELTIATSREPFDGLRMGTYFSTCLSLDDGVNRAAALTNVVEANKHIVFVRDSKRRVVGRKLIAVVEGAGLVGFRTYCNLDEPLTGVVRARVDEVIAAFAARAGLELLSAGSPKTLHRGAFWHDDGVRRWAISRTKLDVPAWWPEHRDILYHRWAAQSAVDLAHTLEEGVAYERELRARMAAARVPVSDVWSVWSSDFDRAGKPALWGLAPEIADDVRELARLTFEDDSRESSLLVHCAEVPRRVLERCVRATLATRSGPAVTLNIDSMLGDGTFIDALTLVEQLAVLYARDTCFPGACRSCYARWDSCASALLVMYAKKPEPRALAAALTAATGDLLAILLRVAREVTHARVAKALRGQVNKIDADHLRGVLLEGLARQADETSRQIVFEHIEEHPGAVWLAGVLVFHHPELVSRVRDVVEYHLDELTDHATLSGLALLDPGGVYKRLRRALSRARDNQDQELGELVRRVLDRVVWRDFGLERLVPSIELEIPGFWQSRPLTRGDDDPNRRRAGRSWLEDRATLLDSMIGVADRERSVSERHEAFEHVMLAGITSLAARATFLIADPEVFADAGVCARWTELADLRDVYFGEAVEFRAWVRWYEWERQHTDGSLVSRRLGEEAGRTSTLYAALLMRSFTKGARARVAQQLVFSASNEWMDLEFMIVSDACHLFPERVRGGDAFIVDALARAILSFNRNRFAPWLELGSSEGYGPVYPVSVMLFVDALRVADTLLFDELMVELESRRDLLSCWVVEWRERWPSLWGEAELSAVVARYEDLAGEAW